MSSETGTDTAADNSAKDKRSSDKGAVFTQGSIMRHVIIMTVTSALGLMSIFFVDAITLFYISLLGDPAQTAAVGRSSYVVGFIIGISVGFMIGVSVVVSRAIGAGQRQDARVHAGAAIIGSFIVGVILCFGFFLAKEWFLDMLDATGPAREYAITYLTYVLIGMPFMVVGMTCMGILRSVGDAKRSMYITLSGGLITAALDPIFIFTFGLEVTGAAIVSMMTRMLFGALGLYFVIGVHDMLDWAGVARFIDSVKKISALSVPAMATNLAAPVGAFLIAEKIAEYGDATIAGLAVVDRLTPLAFGVIFALSGAVGPIIGQNMGAARVDRARQALLDGMIFNAIYVLVACAILFLAQDAIISAFSATGDAALMIRIFVTVIAVSYLFNGILFLTNAAFNNLGKPLWATGFNWARQTIGVLPFIYVGSQLGGLWGIAIGILLGSIPFALVSLFVAFALLKRRAAELAATSEPVPA